MSERKPLGIWAPEGTGTFICDGCGSKSLVETVFHLPEINAAPSLCNLCMNDLVEFWKNKETEAGGESLER